LRDFVVPDEAKHYIAMHRTHIKPDEYAADVEKDFLQIEPFLPETVNTILDIGCGMAGIDVFLKLKYPDAHLCLLDGDGEKFGSGWNKTLDPFSSRAIAGKLLRANGVSVGHWFDIGTKEDLKADLVVSLLSWGFHYPLDTYKVSGFVICDLRIDRERPRGEVIAQTAKYNRCAFHL
jgi:hypothetical protein